MYGITGSTVAIYAQRLKHPPGAPGTLNLEVSFTAYLLP
jgi:hypothetical protein